MSQSVSAYSNLLHLMTRWISTPDDQGGGEALRALAQLLTTLLSSASRDTRVKIKRALYSVSEDELITHLEEIAQREGPKVALAARDLTRVLMDTPQLDAFMSALNLELSARGIKSLVSRELTQAQRALGALVMELTTGERGALDHLAWIGDQGLRGPAALSLLGLPLSARERIDLSTAILDGLSEMHHGRLEISEGFAPERMILKSDLTVYVPVSERTRIKELMSPEQSLPDYIAVDKLGKHSDVWTAARLFRMIYEGSGLARALNEALEIPPEVKQVLQRSLARDPETRFHSGRELRVLLEKLLVTWRARLSHEEQQGVGLIEPSLTFDEVLERREEEQERRVEQRRKHELKVRRRLKWRANLKQVIWTLVIGGVIGGGAWWFYQARLAQLSEATQRRLALTQRDHGFNPIQAGEDMSAHVQWRRVALGARVDMGAQTDEVSRVITLVTTSHVTGAQYERCVKVGQCKEITRAPGCVSVDSSKPRNCVNFAQAQSFARFVGGELLTAQEWRELAFDSELTREYPWGSGGFNSARAALKWSNLARDQRAEPFEVCNTPLGDSPDALCDLIGNVYEWAMVLREPMPTAETQTDRETPTDQETKSELTLSSPPPIIGVVGASWQTRPHTFKRQQFSMRRAQTQDPTIGFRVIKRVSPPHNESLQPAEER